MECPRYSERGKFVEVKSSAKKTRKKKLTSGKLRVRKCSHSGVTTLDRRVKIVVLQEYDLNELTACA